MLLRYFILIDLLTIAAGAWAITPNKQDSVQVFYGKIIDGDTLAQVYLAPIYVFKPEVFKNEREALRYSKLVRDIKKTLPLAKIAGAKLLTVNETLKHITDKKQRKQYLKNTEKELLADYGANLNNLTFSQGRLLIKLIDRECHATSYDLIKLYRGGFTAFFWQTLARTFGANLKSEYNLNDDQKIERIVVMIEQGQL